MNHNEDCLFCKIINNKISSYQIYEDEQVFVFLDINPTTNGHMLVVPKEHLIDTSDILKKEGLLNHILEVAQKIRILVYEKLGATGMTYLWNMDSAQDVKHFHLHLIPKYEEEANEEVLSAEEIYNKYFKQ